LIEFQNFNVRRVAVNNRLSPAAPAVALRASATEKSSACFAVLFSFQPPKGGWRGERNAFVKM